MLFASIIYIYRLCLRLLCRDKVLPIRLDARPPYRWEIMRGPRRVKGLPSSRCRSSSDEPRSRRCCCRRRVRPETQRLTCGRCLTSVPSPRSMFYSKAPLLSSCPRFQTTYLPLFSSSSSPLFLLSSASYIVLWFLSSLKETNEGLIFSTASLFAAL